MMEKIDLQQAHKDLMDAVHSNMNRRAGEVTRSVYTKAMHDVQNKYGLKQGHPQFLEWIFTCVGRSPIIIEDEGAGEDDREN